MLANHIGRRPIKLLLDQDYQYLSPVLLPPQISKFANPFMKPSGPTLTTSAPTSSNTPTIQPQPATKKSKAWIAGAVAGPVLAIVILVLGFWIYKLHKTKTAAPPSEFQPRYPLPQQQMPPQQYIPQQQQIPPQQYIPPQHHLPPQQQMPPQEFYGQKEATPVSPAVELPANQRH